MSRSVTILYFSGCPHHKPTVALVEALARRLGVDVDVQLVEITSASDAMRFRFLGSPTVQIDGQDIEPLRRSDPTFAVTCRMYGASGVPPSDMVASALVEVRP